MIPLEQLLHTPGIFITDGATGTMLQAAGLPAGVSSEAWVLDNPAAIRALQKSYVQAGSDIILTVTFGANPIKLATSGLSDRMVEINQAAVRLAREVSVEKTIVFGDMGPTGKLLQPIGPLSYEDAVQAFAEQAGVLVEAGVDGIAIETMSDLNEARAAVEGVRKVSDLPVAVTMSFDTRGRTMMGVKPAVAAKELIQAGVDIIGANCGRSLEENLQAICEMRQAASQAILWAKPNAGMPRMTAEDKAVYDVTPGEMADYVLKFKQQGIKFFGGCCGSTPEHIKAIHDALTGL